MEDGREGQPPPGRKRKGAEAAIAAKYRRGPEVATRRVSAQASGMHATRPCCCRRRRRRRRLHSLPVAPHTCLSSDAGYHRADRGQEAEGQAAVHGAGGGRCAASGRQGERGRPSRCCGGALRASRTLACFEAADCPAVHAHMLQARQTSAAWLPQVEEWLLPAEAGELEAEGMERTWRFSQADIVQVRASAFAQLLLCRCVHQSSSRARKDAAALAGYSTAVLHAAAHAARSEVGMAACCLGLCSPMQDWSCSVACPAAIPMTCCCANA